jgi:hypothetical protein
VGAFTVTVRVTDNSGLSSTSPPLTITTTRGSPPTVVATVSGVSSATGTVPFSVYFSAWGSRDSDPGGSVVGATWDFGDGTTGSGMSIVHEYKAVGTYVATAQAIDNTGLASSVSAGLTVTVLASTLFAHLDRMTFAVGVTGAGAKRAAVGTVTVHVVNWYGTALPGATVSRTWSGVVASAGTVKAVTNAAGTATFKSLATKVRGTLTFTVTGVVRVGYPYDPSGNTVDAFKSGSSTCSDRAPFVSFQKFAAISLGNAFI